MNLEPSLNTWTIIFLIVVLHGIVLSAIFFTRDKGRKLPNVLLGIFLLLFSLNILSYLAYWTKYNLVFPHVMGMAATFHFLYGPLLFLYVLSVLRPERKLKKIDVLHFLPFLIYLIYVFPIFYFRPAAEKAALLEEAMLSIFQLNDSARLIISLKTLYMAVYAGLIFNLKKLNRFFNIRFRRVPEQKSQWINMVKYCFAGFILSYAGFFILVETIGYSLEQDYIISFAMSAFIFSIGYVGLTKPEYLHEAHNGSKYESSTLEEDQGNKYVEKLLSYMERKKPYIDGDLKLEDVANQLEIPRHHLSQIINERLGKNFFEFVNSYRVEEAKRILSDPEKEDYIILRVALESGFNNKTTFNSAFKNEVGSTPSAFRKKHLKNGILQR